MPPSSPRLHTAASTAGAAANALQRLAFERRPRERTLSTTQPSDAESSDVSAQAEADESSDRVFHCGARPGPPRRVSSRRIGSWWRAVISS